MPKEIKIPEIKINLQKVSSKWWIILGLIILLILFSAWQMYSTSGLRKENKGLNKENKTLLDDVTEKDKKIESDSLEIVKSQVIIDSLYQNELRFKAQLNTVQRRYENYKRNYNNSSSVDKWVLFDELTNN